MMSDAHKWRLLQAEQFIMDTYDVLYQRTGKLFRLQCTTQRGVSWVCSHFPPDYGTGPEVNKLYYVPMEILAVGGLDGHLEKAKDAGVGWGEYGGDMPLRGTT